MARFVSSRLGLGPSCALRIELGVIGEECGCDPAIIGGGGGCIELTGRPCISSTELSTWLPFISPSSTAWPASFGVSGSELGGDTYAPGSIPSIGKVWLRGLCGGKALFGADTEGTRLGNCELCEIYGEAVSGDVKNGLVGDWGPGENVDDPPAL